MKKLIYLLLVLVIAFTSVGFAPLVIENDDVPDDDKFELTIINNSLETVKVKIDGMTIPPYSEAKVYNISADPGTTTATLIEGVYDFSYFSCGAEFGPWTVNFDHDSEFGIDACPSDPVETKFVIYNHQEDPITVNLEGLNENGLAREDYEIEAKFGKTKTSPIWSGWYNFSFDACDSTFGGQIRILKSGITEMTLRSCERQVYVDLDIRGPNPVKTRIANNFSVTVDITLIGPLVYYKKLPPGMNRVEMAPGTYSYIYAANNKRYEGTFVVTRNGTSILMMPFFILNRAR